MRKKRKINLSIPAGVDTGSKLRVAGEGESSEHSGPSGDLYVLIHVKPHEFFEQQGDDIYCQIPIFFPQAALGSRVEVPTLEGTQLLDIPPGPNSGEVFRIRQHGIKHLRGSGWGDQVTAVGPLIGVLPLSPMVLSISIFVSIVIHTLSPMPAGRTLRFFDGRACFPAHVKPSSSSLVQM